MTKPKPKGIKIMISEETRAYYDLKKRNDIRESANHRTYRNTYRRTKKRVRHVLA